MAEYEYRVVWRRKHDMRKRTRLYQTLEGAESFARFITTEPTDDYMEAWAFDHLMSLGEAVDVTVEQRPVGEWASMGHQPVASLGRQEDS